MAGGFVAGQTCRYSTNSLRSAFKVLARTSRRPTTKDSSKALACCMPTGTVGSRLWPLRSSCLEGGCKCRIPSCRRRTLSQWIYQERISRPSTCRRSAQRLYSKCSRKLTVILPGIRAMSLSTFLVTFQSSCHVDLLVAHRIRPVRRQARRLLARTASPGSAARSGSTTSTTSRTPALPTA